MHRTLPVRVVVGVDDSLVGLRALRTAVTEARRRGASLHAVRAWSHDLSGHGGPSLDAEVERAAAERIVAAFADAMGGPPADLDVHVSTIVGPAGPALVRYADRDDDLLVVGHAWRRPLARLVHSSVSRYCAAHATCPVLVVPPDEFARQVRREGIGRAIRRDLPQLAG